MTTAQILRLADGATAEMDFGNGRPIPTVATRRGEWTDFVATPEVSPDLHPWDALERNGRLQGVARLTIERDAWRLRSEARRATTPSVDQVRKSFRQASHVLAGDPDKRKPEPAADEATWTAWTDGVAAAGWRMSGRADQRFVVDLDLKGGFRQATGEPCGRGLRLSVKVGKTEISAPECRLAVARFLLAATDAVRLVRAANTSERGLGLEITLPPGSAPPEVDDALGALALASQLAGLEVDALNDPAFARRYLDLTLSKEQLCEWTTAVEFSCSK